MKKFFKPTLTILVLFAGIVNHAYGYQTATNVWVNGVRLTPTQLRLAEKLYGGPIASGRYWLDKETGIWGYEGGPAQGRLGDGGRVDS